MNDCKPIEARQQAAPELDAALERPRRDGAPHKLLVSASNPNAVLLIHHRGKHISGHAYDVMSGARLTAEMGYAPRYMQGGAPYGTIDINGTQFNASPERHAREYVRSRRKGARPATSAALCASPKPKPVARTPRRAHKPGAARSKGERP